MALVSSLAALLRVLGNSVCVCAPKQLRDGRTGQPWDLPNGTAHLKRILNYGYRLYNDFLCKLRVQTNA